MPIKIEDLKKLVDDQASTIKSITALNEECEKLKSSAGSDASTIENMIDGNDLILSNLEMEHMVMKSAYDTVEKAAKTRDMSEFLNSPIFLEDYLNNMKHLNMAKMFLPLTNLQLMMYKRLAPDAKDQKDKEQTPLQASQNQPEGSNKPFITTQQSLDSERNARDRKEQENRETAGSKPKTS